MMRSMATYPSDRKVAKSTKNLPTPCYRFLLGLQQMAF